MRMDSTELRGIVEEHLNEPTTCYGHCEKESRLKFVDGEDLKGCYACPAGYVSRIVTYGDDVDVSGFKSFLENAVQGSQDIQDQDIRIASRYTWDLGVESEKERILKEAYWTQNYRRTKSSDPDRAALFLCTKCNQEFVVQPVSSKSSLCENCS